MSEDLKIEGEVDATDDFGGVSEVEFKPATIEDIEDQIREITELINQSKGKKIDLDIARGSLKEAIEDLKDELKK